MPPTSEHKPKQFAFVLSQAEHDMLADLAAASEMTKASLLRLWIRSEYLKAHANKRPGAPVPMTLRAIVGELSRPEHLTAGNLADRIGLKVERLNHYLSRVAVKINGARSVLLETVDKTGRGPHWTWALGAPKEKVLEAIERAGFDLDEPLAAPNPDADDER